MTVCCPHTPGGPHSLLCLARPPRRPVWRRALAGALRRVSELLDPPPAVLAHAAVDRSTLSDPALAASRARHPSAGPDLIEWHDRDRVRLLRPRAHGASEGDDTL